MNDNQKAIRVAIVDDNAQLRYITVNQLENSGYIVQFEVGNVQKALQIIKKDVELPDVCVVEEDFAAAKLLLEEHPHLRVLFLSTDDAVKSVTDMLRAGVSGYRTFLQKLQR
ncbi:response regulator [Olivibacter sp. XZL3]|uniref:response regulator n=1 Tax=Olivibacter sp. XZL3 TaxID=1735116 RepID=UPI00106662C0|nr:response regulator [Olivibacter sp. XZL3]